MAEQLGLFARAEERLDTLARAREMVRQAKGAGVRCPCCDRLVETLQQHLTLDLVLALAGGYRAEQDRKPVGGWIEAKEFGGACLEPLLLWGLLERGKEEWWRLTDTARMFLGEKISLPETVYYYREGGRNVVEGYSKGRRAAQDFFRRPEDYDRVMGWKEPVEG